ncbi:uncharacterized protein C8A04DRAFT_32928 [Dichotomopilus funicola]|uniref:RDD domain-containing protein n=1 Tax=Dichotomopilus funicola TaxID=1934379 RepID=A0AAN6UVL1_9PEZI|nr:hypothetical protein C8A04DRAFT_32928 [Dichotomopilus funicola]
MLSQLRQLELRRPWLALIVAATHLLTEAVSGPTNSALGVSTAYDRSTSSSYTRKPTLQNRNNAPVEPLPPSHWELAGSAEDIEAFRLRHNLTLVSATPQDAALMPSWPQALFQYVLVAPPINCYHTSSYTHSQTTTFNGVVTSHSQHGSSHTITPFNVLQKDTGGWMSVLGWEAWFDLAFLVFGPFALGPLLFQWVASFALVIQRWSGGLGTVAYQINNLNGCIPADGNAGIAFLQQGARSRDFRILQSVTFPVSTLFMVLSFGDPDGFNRLLALPALGELIYTAVLADKGTPVVVSGICMLVELNPSKGFLDSSINTRWKIFASFMGF